MLYYLYKIAEFIIKALPLKAAYGLATGLANIKHFFSVKDKRIIVNNLKVVLGEDNPGIGACARAVIQNFCKYLVDFLRQDQFTKADIGKFVKVKGLENLQEAYKKGKGVINLSAHIGDWELGGAVIGRLGFPINAIALRHKDKRINDFFNRRREMNGMHVTQVGGSVKKCLKLLDKNEAIAVLADRDFSKSDLTVRFFGKSAVVPKGVGIFKLKKDCAIVPTFVIRQPDGTHELILEKAIRYDPGARDVKSIVQKSLEVVEKYVRKYPEQWFMFGEVWPEAR